MIRGYLAGEGIDCEVRNEHLIGGMGELPITTETLPQIWVAATDRERARELIQRALRQEQPPGANWTCPRCSEEIEGQFSECWRCGAGRPAT